SAGILEAANGHALGNNPDEMAATGGPNGLGITVANNATLAIAAGIKVGDGTKVLTLNGVGVNGPGSAALEGVGNPDAPATVTPAEYAGPIVLAGAGQDTIGADPALMNALPF